GVARVSDRGDVSPGLGALGRGLASSPDQAARRDRPLTGRWRKNVEPSPGLLMKSTVPPCASRIFRGEDRPIPVPGIRSRTARARENGRKIRSFSSGEIPKPWSETAMVAHSDCEVRVTSIVPPPGLNLTALLRRLFTACDSRVGSPLTG